jgi:hypothetical protein
MKYENNKTEESASSYTSIEIGRDKNILAFR